MKQKPKAYYPSVADTGLVDAFASLENTNQERYNQEEIKWSFPPMDEVGRSSNSLADMVVGVPKYGKTGGLSKLLPDREQLYSEQELKRAIRLGIWEGAKKQPNCPNDIETILLDVMAKLNSEKQ